MLVMCIHDNYKNVFDVDVTCETAADEKVIVGRRRLVERYDKVDETTLLARLVPVGHHTRYAVRTLVEAMVPTVGRHPVRPHAARAVVPLIEQRAVAACNTWP